MGSWPEHALRGLSTCGHRVTEPRRAILERMAQYAQPFTAEQLWADLAGAKGPAIGRATIYRTVELLLEQGWLARVHWSRSKETATEAEHAFVPVEPGHQHHLVCKNCGLVIAFENCNIEALLGGLAKRFHFQVEGHWIEAHGLCQNCQHSPNNT